MNEVISQIVTDILGVCEPLRIILFAEKHTMSTGKLKTVSLCVIVPAGTHCRALRIRLHLAISMDMPVNLSVYSVDEWEDLLDDHTSYASWIDKKGQVIYEQAT